MAIYPTIQAYDAAQEVIDVFGGLNTAEKISEGEWSSELNMSADRYPMLSVRGKRSRAAAYDGSIISVLEKEKLWVLWIESRVFETDWYPNDRTPKELACWVTNNPQNVGAAVLHFTWPDEWPTGMVSFGSYIIVLGINQWFNTATGETGKIENMPKMDYVIESQNRLWGCYYGEKEVEENGETVTKMVNEIYASELGDFKSWTNYDGTSMASYAASVGTDGKWTGAVSYQGKPHFFKENHVHKIYVSATGAHQIVDSPILGVHEGCDNSLCVLDGNLYYMSREGICRYDGSTPVVISEPLGKIRCEYASFGGWRGKLYAYVFRLNDDDTMTDRLYTYDTKHGIWHEEKPIDGENGSIAFGREGDSFCAISAGMGHFSVPHQSETLQTILWDLAGVKGTAETEEEVVWNCTSGLIGWQTVEQKYVSRFDLRLTLPEGARMTVSIEYDSSGEWEEQGTVTGGGTGSIMIPVRPRRCDHFRIRLNGRGEMRLYSLAKRTLKGSDVVL